MVSSRPDTDECDRNEDLQLKLDRLSAVIAGEKELYGSDIIEKNDAYDTKSSELTGEFLELFFDAALRPIKHDLQFSMVARCVGHMMLDQPPEYSGTLEEAIDAALQEAIDEATSPHQTGLLALVRYRIESQRQQLASA